WQCGHGGGGQGIAGAHGGGRRRGVLLRIAQPARIGRGSRSRRISCCDQRAHASGGAIRKKWRVVSKPRECGPKAVSPAGHAGSGGGGNKAVAGADRRVGMRRWVRRLSPVKQAKSAE